MNLDKDKIRKRAFEIRAINHPLRYNILELLEKNQEMTVTDIYIKLRLEQSVASQHLAVLRNAGIVEDNRSGKFIYYSLKKEGIKHFEQFT